MNQRIRVLQELGEELERVARPKPTDSRAPSGPRLGSPPRISSRLARGVGVARRVGFGGVVSAFVSVGSVVVVIGAIVLLGHAHRGSEPATGAASKRQLLAQYAILRRPQTAADRVDAGTPPNLDAGPS